MHFGRVVVIHDLAGYQLECIYCGRPQRIVGAAVCGGDTAIGSNDIGDIALNIDKHESASAIRTQRDTRNNVQPPIQQVGNSTMNSAPVRLRHDAVADPAGTRVGRQ